MVAIRNPHKTTHGICALVAHNVALAPGVSPVRLLRASLNHSVIIAVEHDVADIRTGGGAEQAHIVAGRFDVQVLDIVVPTVIATAEPVIEHHAVGVVCCDMVYGAGNGIELPVVFLLFCLPRFLVRAVEVMGLLPALSRAVPLRVRPRLLGRAGAVGILQIRKQLVIVLCDKAGGRACAIHIAPVDELELVRRADLIGKPLSVRLRRTGLDIVLRAGRAGSAHVVEGIAKERADRIPVSVCSDSERPFRVPLIR